MEAAGTAAATAANEAVLPTQRFDLTADMSDGGMKRCSVNNLTERRRVGPPLRMSAGVTPPSLPSLFRLGKRSFLGI